MTVASQSLISTGQVNLVPSQSAAATSTTALAKVVVIAIKLTSLLV